ncbi:hypothetical protein HML84_02770 [Alcanivorax sp. IO_7]|nr:hypothetical protein HML84_02770 [Alcanivorax sp. IO_7]
MLVVPVWMDDERQLDGEVAKLSDTLTLLNEQSLFGGRLMALRLTERGWTPLVYDVGERQFVPAQGNGLQARRLPAGLELTWQLDDLPSDEEERMGLDQVAERLVSDNPFGGGEEQGQGGLLDEERARAEERAGRTTTSRTRSCPRCSSSPAARPRRSPSPCVPATASTWKPAAGSAPWARCAIRTTRKRKRRSPPRTTSPTTTIN